MQEMSSTSDAGFVVDWQIAEDSQLLDLSTAESEVILPVEVRADLHLGTSG